MIQPIVDRNRNNQHAVSMNMWVQTRMACVYKRSTGGNIVACRGATKILCAFQSVRGVSKYIDV